MRITNQLTSYNTLSNYQTSLKDIYDLNQRFDSGLKIQNSYDDSGIYVDGTRLEYEINLLEQVKETTTKATEFSKNSDQALNDFVKQLENFKTKLIQAANDIHDETSRNAIANDLESIKTHLINIANSSINGQFLFSGTALDTKPIDSLGNYLGNNKQISANIGPNQTTAYNIDGYTLFLGKDNDYKNILTTNIGLVNNIDKIRDNAATNYVTADNQLKDIIGGNYRSEALKNEIGNMNPDTDFTDTTKLADTTFFMQGRKPNGETFATKFKMSADSSVQSLLDNIGYALGNDKNGKNKIVDVSINNSGQIEVKDLKSGNQLMDFSIFGLTDAENVETYTVGDKDIVIDPASHADFNVKKDGNSLVFDSTTTTGMKYTITQNADGTMKVDATNKATGVTNTTNNINLTGDKFVLNPADFAGGVDAGDFKAYDKANAQALSAKGSRDENGKWVSSANLTNLDNIEENVKNGLVYMTEFIKSGFTTSTGAKSTSADYNELRFEKNSNVLTGNVSQIVKNTNEFATDATKLSEVAGGDLKADPNSNITMNIHSKDGNNYKVQINFTDANSNLPTNYPTLSITRVDANFEEIPGTNPVYSGNIYTGKYNDVTKTTDGVKTEANDISYKQLGDIISMVAAGNLPTGDSVTATNNINNLTNADITTTAGIANVLKAGVADPNVQAAIDAAVGTLTLPLADLNTAKSAVKDALSSNNDFVNSMYSSYNKAVDNAGSSVSAGLNYRGEMQITDKSGSATNIEISMFEENSAEFGDMWARDNAGNFIIDAAGNRVVADTSTKQGSLFSFTSNNAIAIDEPSIDIFKNLDEMIQAVRNGSYRADANAENPRTTGVQGALKKIDHLKDHINKQHTQIGSYTNLLTSTNDRVSTLKVNVSTVKSEIMDADYGETYIMFQQRLIGYQAMLQATSKINQVSLLNYM